MTSAESRAEHLSSIPYVELPEIKDILKTCPYLHYDKEGNLFVGKTRIIDLIHEYGTPLKIIDTRIVTARCLEFHERLTHARAKTKYPGEHLIFDATKANPRAEILTAALRSGVIGIETSTVQDLENLKLLAEAGILDPKNVRIICNGFKIPTQNPSRSPLDNPQVEAQLPPFPGQKYLNEPASYGQVINELHSQGFNIVPILDMGELEQFPDITSFGLRLKFGKVSNYSDLARHQSRFGFDLQSLIQEAEKITASGRSFEMLHTMVGAAETVPVDQFLKHLLFAADIWFELKQRFPSLKSLNIGGGVPPLGNDYDHTRLFEQLFLQIKAKAQALSLPVPDLAVEPGSLVAEEAGFVAFKPIQTKSNFILEDGSPGNWGISDVSLMIETPDMLFLSRNFPFLAINNANRPAIKARIGGITCDSDDATKQFIYLPKTDEELFMLIPRTGAYQDTLVGAGGTHHCQLRDAKEFIISQDYQGRVRYGLCNPQTAGDISYLMGYREEQLAELAELQDK